MQQTTIQRSITFSGIGVHSGQCLNVMLHPASENTGIVFEVITGDTRHTLIPSPSAVIATKLATTIGNKNITISTVEHLLASIRGLEIDNIRICVEGAEIPIMDGSAKIFTNELLQAGIKYLPATKKILQVIKPVEFIKGEKRIRALPYNGFKLDYTINYIHPIIGHQRLVLDVTPTTFLSIANARTYGFLKDVEQMLKNGLAQGGSLENAIVLDSTKVINPEGLRYPDEFVRHKALDFIGDMAMMHLPLQGYFEIYCSGHQHNNQFLHKLQDKNALALVTLEGEKTQNLYQNITPLYNDALALL